MQYSAIPTVLLAFLRPITARIARTCIPLFRGAENCGSVELKTRALSASSRWDKGHGSQTQEGWMSHKSTGARRLTANVIAAAAIAVIAVQPSATGAAQGSYMEKTAYCLGLLFKDPRRQAQECAGNYVPEPPESLIEPMDSPTPSVDCPQFSVERRIWVPEEDGDFHLITDPTAEEWRIRVAGAEGLITTPADPCDIR